jgi:hypothetical protein
MMLYDVYYKDMGLDAAVRLPKASTDMERARNINWDGHTLRPSRRGHGYVWVDAEGKEVSQ